MLRGWLVGQVTSRSALSACLSFCLSACVPVKPAGKNVFMEGFRGVGRSRTSFRFLVLMNGRLS